MNSLFFGDRKITIISKLVSCTCTLYFPSAPLLILLSSPLQFFNLNISRIIGRNINPPYNAGLPPRHLSSLPVLPSSLSNVFHNQTSCAFHSWNSSAGGSNWFLPLSPSYSRGRHCSPRNNAKQKEN